LNARKSAVRTVPRVTSMTLTDPSGSSTAPAQYDSGSPSSATATRPLLTATLFAPGAAREVTRFGLRGVAEVEDVHRPRLRVRHEGALGGGGCHRAGIAPKGRRVPAVFYVI
jgi:hypothetical protein